MESRPARSFFAAQFDDRRLDFEYGLGQGAGLSVQFNVLGEQARAVFSEALDLAAYFVAARGHVAMLLVQSSEGRLSGTIAFFEGGELGTERRMGFGCLGGFGLNFLARLTQGFEGGFAIGASFLL